MTFASFLDSLSFQPGTCILLDNASIHKGEDVRAVAQAKGFTLCYTPPYSPEMNPIELVFGAIKQRYYRQRLSWPGDFTSLILDSLHAGTPITVQNCFQHVGQRYWMATNSSRPSGASNLVDT